MEVKPTVIECEDFSKSQLISQSFPIVSESSNFVVCICGSGNGSQSEVDSAALSQESSRSSSVESFGGNEHNQSQAAEEEKEN